MITNNIYLKLKTEIEKGSYRIGEMLPPIRKLSETEGVACNTVWGAYKKLLEDNYIESVPRVGYRIKTGGDAFVSAPIAYILTRANIENNFDLMYRKIFDALKIEASTRNWKIIQFLLSSGDEEYLLNYLGSAKLSGIIIDTPNDIVIQWCQKNKIPMVVIDDPMGNFPSDSIIQNNFQGGFKAVDHLLKKQKCQDFIWIGRPRGHYHVETRFAGSLSALTLNKKSFLIELNLNSADKTSYNQIKETFDQIKKPFAAVCYFRSLTHMIVEYCHTYNLEIGKDIFLATWSCHEIFDEDIGAALKPGWEIVFAHWQCKELAIIALNTLKHRLNNPSSPKCETLVPMYIEDIKKKHS